MTQLDLGNACELRANSISISGTQQWKRVDQNYPDSISNSCSQMMRSNWRTEEVTPSRSTTTTATSGIRRVRNRRTFSTLFMSPLEYDLPRKKTQLSERGLSFPPYKAFGIERPFTQCAPPAGKLAGMRHISHQVHLSL